MSASSSENSKSPLDAAQKIVAELAGMAPDQQTLAIRFAIETLSLKMLPTSSSLGLGLATHQAQPVVGAGSDHSTDIRSFKDAKAPKSDRQFAALVAYFYQFEAKPESRRDNIDAELMKEAARLARWPQVARWSMTLTNAKNAGYLDSVGAGKFKLSSVGENLVAMTLPGNGSAGPNKNNNHGMKPRKKTSKKKK